MLAQVNRSQHFNISTKNEQIRIRVGNGVDIDPCSIFGLWHVHRPHLISRPFDHAKPRASGTSFDCPCCQANVEQWSGRYADDAILDNPPLVHQFEHVNHTNRWNQNHILPRVICLLHECEHAMHIFARPYLNEIRGCVLAKHRRPLPVAVGYQGAIVVQHTDQPWTTIVLCSLSWQGIKMVNVSASSCINTPTDSLDSHLLTISEWSIALHLRCINGDVFRRLVRPPFPRQNRPEYRWNHVNESRIQNG